MGVVTNKFEGGPNKDHFSSNFWADDFDVIFFFIICPIGINWLKTRKICWSTPCHVAALKFELILTLIVKQQSSWMEGRAIWHNFKREPPKDHPSQVWLNFSGLRGEDLNVKVYDVPHIMDTEWWQKLL